MITLSKDMEIGVAKVDAQHRELVDRLNAVTVMGIKSVSKEETQKTLKLLEEYVVKHFGDEEELQKEHNYPKYEWHKQQHQSFILEFLKLKKEFIDNGHSPKFSLTLRDSIINWVVKHIKYADKEIGEHIRSREKSMV